jgi:hypothetical protein
MASRQFEQARCFFAKATQLDKHHAHSWIAFGHAFAEQVSFTTHTLQLNLSNSHASEQASSTHLWIRQEMLCTLLNCLAGLHGLFLLVKRSCELCTGAVASFPLEGIPPLQRSVHALTLALVPLLLPSLSPLLPWV